MDHYGYVIIKYHINNGKRVNYSHKAKHNHAIMEIIESMDTSLKYVGSLNTSQSIGEKELDMLFNELCRMRGGLQLHKVTVYSHKLNKTNTISK